MHTWEDEIATALCRNGESWEDIEYTPFTDEQLGMSPDDSDGDLHFSGHDVAAYTKEFVYYVDFDMDWGYASVHSLPRHPRNTLRLSQVDLAVKEERESCAMECENAADYLSACPTSPENRAAVSALRGRASVIRARSRVRDVL